MADPNPYVPGFDYSSFEGSNPTLPKPGGQLDNDFANIATATQQAVDAIKDVRRSDGALNNGIVTIDSLADDVKALLGENEYLNIVGQNIDDIITVADNIADVNTVSANMADVNTVAADIVNINAVAADLANIDAVAADLTNIGIVATNIVDVNNFADVYQGAKAADPTLRNDGSPLQPGDLYFNTALNVMKVYTTTGEWLDATSMALNMVPNSFVGDGAQTDFTLSAEPGVAANVLVWVGGVRQLPTTDYTVSGTTLILLAAPGNGVAVDTLVVATVSTLNVPAEGSVTLPTLADDVVVRLGFDTVADAEATTIPGTIDRIIVTGRAYDKIVEISDVGPDLVTNGDFDTDTDWSKGTGWTISGDAAHASSITTGGLRQVMPLPDGRVVRVRYTVSNYVSGDIAVRLLGGGRDEGVARTANGTYNEYLYVDGDNEIQFRSPSQSSTTLDIDNVSVGLVFGSFRSSDGALWAPASLESFTALGLGTMRSSDGRDNPSALVTHPQRFGLWDFDPKDRSADIAAGYDVGAGVLTTPFGDTTGVSGAWVRRYRGPAYVDMFGAVGDGVTNDDNAIQNALDYLSFFGEGYRPQLAFGVGVYRITQPLIIDQDFVKLQGQGLGRQRGSITTSIPAGSSGGGSAILYDGSVIGGSAGVIQGTSPTGLQIQDLSILCQKRACGIFGEGFAMAQIRSVYIDQPIVGIRWMDTSYSAVIDAVEVFDPTQGGMDFRANCHSTTVSNSRFNNQYGGLGPTAETPEYCVRVGFIGNSSAMNFIGNNFDLYNITAAQFFCGSNTVRNLNLIGNYIECRGDGITAAAVILGAGDGINISGNRITKSDSPTPTPIDYAIQMQGSTRGVSVTGNYFSGFDTACVRVANGAGNLFFGSNARNGVVAVNDQNANLSSVIVDNGVLTAYDVQTTI